MFGTETISEFEMRRRAENFSVPLAPMLRDSLPPTEVMLGIPVFGRLRTAFHGSCRYSLSISNR